MFGRGGEELERLEAMGIPFEVVPGVTAASAVTAYAGIPVTHRDYGSSVHLITAHKKRGCEELPDFETLAKQGRKARQNSGSTASSRGTLLITVPLHSLGDGSCKAVSVFRFCPVFCLPCSAHLYAAEAGSPAARRIRNLKITGRNYVCRFIFLIGRR